MSKLFVTDEGHWITINGNHVLINEKGEVQAGLGGKFNGRRISKFNTKVPKTEEELEKARQKAWGKRREAEAEIHNIVNSKEYKKAEREIKKIDKEMDGRYYAPRRNPERHASLESLRQQYKDQQETMLKKANERFKDADKRDDNIRRAIREGNGTFTNLTTKSKKLKNNIANAERNIAARQAKVKAKVDAIKAKYNKMAERVEKSNIGEASWERRHLASAVQRRGEERARNVETAAREGAMWAERKRDALFGNKADLKYTNRQINALKKFKNNIEPKLKSATEANKFIANAKGTKVSPLTSGMTGGKFSKPREEVRKNGIDYVNKWNDRIAEYAGAHASHDPQKLRDVEEKYRKEDERHRNERNNLLKKEVAARQALEKARPKIAERRQAIKAYNEREDDKYNRAFNLGKYRKPYYETDAFKAGQEERNRGTGIV